MGIEVQPGKRYRSAVCDAELVVVKAPAGEVDLRSGGHPVVPVDDERPEGLGVESGFEGELLVGKRYTDEAGTIEVLCTKAGRVGAVDRRRRCWPARTPSRSRRRTEVRTVHLGMLLQMAADGMADRTAIGSLDGGLTMADLATHAQRVGAALADKPGERVVLVDLNSEAVPLALFGSALAGKPFVPVNYRLADDQLQAILERTAPATLIVGEGVLERIGTIDGLEVMTRDELLAIAADERCAAGRPVRRHRPGEPGGPAVHQSGTTGEPKAAVLRHKNLASYILMTVEFAGAGEDEATIVSRPAVPHRRDLLGAVGHLRGSPGGAPRGVRPGRVGGHRAGRGRHPRHGRADHAEPDPRRDRGRRRRPAHVAGAVLRRRSDAGAGHRAGHRPAARGRLRERLRPDRDLLDDRPAGSRRPPGRHRLRRPRGAGPARLGGPAVAVGRGDDPRPAGQRGPAGERGEIWVRGEQVSGEYLNRDDDRSEGWFNTRDAGHLDAEGFLFVHGRLDDVIVRGGENLSPGEIEAVLLEHPAVAEAAVVGVPDTEWGEKVVAAVVLNDGASVEEAELQDLVRSKLRSTRTPEHIDIRDELPYNETGKLLRRVLKTELAEPEAAPPDP